MPSSTVCRMTRWILRRFKHICAKANRKAKRNGHAAVPLLFAQKEPPRAAKGFNWIVRDCCLCALIRGLQNLESPLKGFNCCGAKLRLQCADARFAKPRISLQRERVVTFCVVQKVTKKHTGLRPATSIQSSVEEDFSRVFRRHVSKPVFRTKRRRKGFESGRRSGVTA